MIVYCYNNKSDKRCLKKDLKLITQCTVVMKEQSSIYSPTLVLSTLSMTSLGSMNYIKIPEFSRSYFIKNITMLRKGLFEITCECDVLSSFASQILQNNAIIERQTEQYHSYIEDPNIPITSDPYIVIKNFQSITEESYVLVAIGYSDSSSQGETE